MNMMIHILLPSLLGLVSCQSADQECNFTADCQELPRCVNIADASCVCNFGKCVISGSYPFFREQDRQCTNYTDCSCRDDKKNCFCRDGICSTTAWECHETSDCKPMKKCKDKACNCQDNLCSWECDTTADCKDHYCNKANGYTCECEESLCAYKQKPKECNGLKDCVARGFCSEKEPCTCTSNYCNKPWYVGSDGTNCRTDKDCMDTIAKCQETGCTCSNIKDISQYEKRGTCAFNDAKFAFGN